jgi:hypothetical protein
MNKKSAMTMAAGVVMALMAGVVGVSRQAGQAAVKSRVVVVRTAAAPQAQVQAPVWTEQEEER